MLRAQRRRRARAAESLRVAANLRVGNTRVAARSGGVSEVLRVRALYVSRDARSKWSGLGAIPRARRAIVGYRKAVNHQNLAGKKKLAYRKILASLSKPS